MTTSLVPKPIPHSAVLAGVIVALLASTLAGALEEHDWPSFRGPESGGHGTGSPRVTWDGETGDGVLWTLEIPGLAHSSPVVWGDRLFVTTAVSDSGEASLKVGLYGDIKPVDDEGVQRWKVLAIEKQSGKILWEQTAHKGVPEIKRHTKSTHANSTPATDGKRVVAFFGSEGLYAYDLDGKLLWQTDFGVLDSGFYLVKGAQWGFSSSPILHDDKVIVQVDVQEGSFVAALDAANGKEVWRTSRDEVPTFGSPAVIPYTGEGGSGKQVVVNGWKHIGGYDLETGKELWKLVGGGDIPVPTPIYDQGLILITSAHGKMRPIYAIETAASGTITTDSDAVAWWHERAGNYMQTPLIHDGLAYFCLDNGVTSVYELETGERLYQQRLGGGSSGFSGSPVVAGGHVYFTSEDGDTFVLRAGREFELVATNQLGETFMSTPAISDGVMYFRARRHLFAIGAD